MVKEILVGSLGIYKKIISAIPYEGDFVVAKTTPCDADTLPVLFTGGADICLVSMKDVEIIETLRE